MFDLIVSRSCGIPELQSLGIGDGCHKFGPAAICQCSTDDCNEYPQYATATATIPSDAFTCHYCVGAQCVPSSKTRKDCTARGSKSCLFTKERSTGLGKWI